MNDYRNQLVIFSKNRACQLNLLLDSINKNAPHLFDKIHVLYRADNEYSPAYEKLKTIHHPINFFSENNFRWDLLKLINDGFDTTTFMVDDAVIFNEISINKVDILKPVVEDSVIFSLRLGENCNYSHPANLHYTLGEHNVSGEFLIFDYTKQQAGDFRYPLSTDGHIFKTESIKELLIEINFNNPNTLEANLQQFVIGNLIPKTVMCFRQSKLVSIPVNLVNDTFQNRHGLEFGMSEKELNDRFLNGEIIDLNAMDFLNINGPHKEIKYIFKTC
jgi:hypothetical protein